MNEVEDVWAVVRERNGLRAKVKRLETENAKLRTIIASYAAKTPMKPADVTAAHDQRRPQSARA